MRLLLSFHFWFGLLVILIAYGLYVGATCLWEWISLIPYINWRFLWA